jgi:hypothetical protein
LFACAPPFTTFIIGTGVCIGPAPAEVAKERQSGLLRGGLRDRHRNREHRVRAEARLGLGAVELDQRAVDEALLGRIQADDRLGNLGVDRLDRLQHALAAVALRIAIAQLDRFAAAGRGARGHRGASHDARLEQHVRFDRRIAARIQDLPSHHVDDRAHQFFFLCFSLGSSKFSARSRRLTCRSSSASVSSSGSIRSSGHAFGPVGERALGRRVRFHEKPGDAARDRGAREHRDELALPARGLP